MNFKIQKTKNKKYRTCSKSSKNVFGTCLDERLKIIFIF